VLSANLHLVNKNNKKDAGAGLERGAVTPRLSVFGLRDVNEVLEHAMQRIVNLTVTCKFLFLNRLEEF